MKFQAEIKEKIEIKLYRTGKEETKGTTKLEAKTENVMRKIYTS